MNAAIIVNLAAYLVAIGFGLFAIASWRRRGVPVRRGLGLTLDRRTAPDIGAGVLIAAAAMVAILAVELALGGVRAGAGAFDVPAALGFGLFLVLSGIIDEVLMRGMLISGLSAALGGRPMAAVLIGGVLFGMTHMFFAGASALSVVSNSLGGVMYGLAFILTGRIWLGLGLHFSWNFVQGPLLGFILSGHPVAGALFRVDDLGPAWLTGGLYGPEGGVVGVAFRLVVIAGVLAWARIAGSKMNRPLHI
jgi:membrane protease YdiL (CAAX protease family)